MAVWDGKIEGCGSGVLVPGCLVVLCGRALRHTDTKTLRIIRSILMSRDVFGSMVLAAGICFLSLAGSAWAQPEVPQPPAGQPAGHPIVNALSKPAGEAAATAVMPANP